MKDGKVTVWDIDAKDVIDPLNFIKFSCPIRDFFIKEKEIFMEIMIFLLSILGNQN